MSGGRIPVRQIDPGALPDGNYLLSVLAGKASLTAFSPYTDEQVRDVIAATLHGLGGIVVTADDPGDAINIDGSGVSGGGGGGGGATPNRILLAEINLTATSATLDFPGVGQAYDDLELVVQGSMTAGNQILVSLNGDTTNANYSRQALRGGGSVASAGAAADRWIGTFGSVPSTFTANIKSYTKTTITKIVTARTDYASDMYLNNVRWGTAAVTQVTLTASGTTFAAGTRARLYGYKDLASGGAVAWQAWTPTLNNFTGTVNFARYKTDGRTCRVQVAITLDAAPTGRMEVVMPLTALATLPTGNMGPVGTCIGNDVGTARRNGAAFFLTGNVIAFGSTDAATFWGVSTPHVWASGDTVAFNAEFELA